MRLKLVMFGWCLFLELLTCVPITGPLDWWSIFVSLLLGACPAFLLLTTIHTSLKWAENEDEDEDE